MSACGQTALPAGVLGPHGIAGNNDTSLLLLLRTRTEHRLLLTNAFFRLSMRKKVTRMHPRSRSWQLLDYVIVQRRDLQDLMVTKAICDVNGWTDHRLVSSKMTFCLQARRGPQERRPPPDGPTYDVISRKVALWISSSGYQGRDHCPHLQAQRKIFVCIPLNRLNRYLEQGLLPEGHFGFRRHRVTINMAFAARQLQEMRQEMRTRIYSIFVDLTKAFDTADNEGLWKIMQRFAYPERFMNMVRQSQDGMMARVTENVTISEAFAVANGEMLMDAYRDERPRIRIAYKTNGHRLNSRRMQAPRATIYEYRPRPAHCR
nr:unnamed protein product [Spirometra erinaceieuropaei]